MVITTVLADDHQAYRSALRMLLAQEPDISVVAEAADGRDAVRIARELAPLVITMDVTMPRLNGIEATRQILATNPSVRVLALTVHADRRFVEAMTSAGASGYVLKDCPFKELARAIRVVAAGGTYVSPQLAVPADEDTTAEGAPQIR